MANDNGNAYDDDSFEDYVPVAVDPGPLLFWLTLAVVMILMLVIMPIMVGATKKKRRKKKKKIVELTMANPDENTSYINIAGMGSHPLPPPVPYDKYRATCWSVFRVDKEARRILRYTIPFTIYAVAAAIMDSVCVALIGNYIGTKQLAAYVLVNLLTALSDEFLKGTMHANTTLCAHAIGAANNTLAGSYVQLSIMFYFVLGVPVAIFWMFFTGDLILWLSWGDEHVAQYADEFVRIYIWSKFASAVHMAFDQLLDVANREIFTTVVGLLESAATVFILVALFVGNTDATLRHVALVHVVTSAVFLAIMLGISYIAGWLKPFRQGIFGSLAITDGRAVSIMVKTSIPLSFGSVLNNAEWVILAVFAAHLGEAEVTTWAIVGSLWEVSDSLVAGIGDAAEIRVAYHLGNNHPSLAKLSAYKSMMIGMFGAIFISGTFYIYMDMIPELFTKDETLQEMMASVLPFLGIGNIALSFGYLCWYILGAQGKYKLGTWLHLVASWGFTLPLGFYFTYEFNWDLQGLTAAVVLGYVVMGASVASCVLTANWKRRAQKIYDLNLESDSEEEDDGEAAVEKKEAKEEQMYAALSNNRTADPVMANRNVLVLTAPPGLIGIRIGDKGSLPGCVVVEVTDTSPFNGQLFPGDMIIGVDGKSVQHESANGIYEMMRDNAHEDRVLTVLTPYCRDEDTADVLAGNVEDIDDFEDAGWYTLFDDEHQID